MWSHPAYRRVAPGELAVGQFLEVADPRPGSTIRDLGCGTGRAGLALHRAGFAVTQYDFAANCRDAEVEREGIPFVQQDLNEAITGIADFAYCTDVLEHIPPEQVKRVLRVVVGSARKVYLQIACTPDHMGALIGEPLHLTVEPYAWWKAELEDFDCEILWSEDKEHTCAFLVSGYADAVEFGPKTVLNVSHETVETNVRANLAAGYAEVAPHAATDVPLMIMAGGPSLNDYKDEIIERRMAGEFLVTVNNTHQIAREWGLEPSIQIMCDAREFNKRFVENPFPRTKYLIASQCDPGVAASLPKEQVLLWHSGHHIKSIIEDFDNQRGEGRAWYPVFGGGTVILRGIPLLMLLGFRKFELFGFDSCLVDDAHHAYHQPENDRKLVVDVTVGGRTFKCHPWMVAQAGDFLRLMQSIGKTIDLAVRGDGLIAHAIKTAAEES
jgi:SAM-dependent methyltransferase